MPYSIRFSKSVALSGREHYFNECCMGGDIVLEYLLPALMERFGTLEAEQEDWGWFVWFEHAGVKLAVDVHTQDFSAGEFEIHLTSRRPRFLLGAKVEDGPVLEALRERVVSSLQAWQVSHLVVEHVNDKYMV